MEWLVVKTILSLLAVLALMAGIVVVLKNYAYKGRTKDSSIVSVDVLGHRMLTPKRSVHVLKVLNTVLVVGVTEGGMTSLGEIRDEESLREVTSRMSRSSKDSSPFSGFVEKYMASLFPNGAKRADKPARMFLG